MRVVSNVSSRYCKACGQPFEPKATAQAYCNKICRYHEREFRGWDGEGITVPSEIWGDSHNFNLLATRGEYISSGRERLGTTECLKFLCKRRSPCINIWYFNSYDITCILRDIPLRGPNGSLEELAKTNETTWRGWHIKYVPNKIFIVRRGRQYFESYDVFGYYQKSFVKACEENGIDASDIKAMKDNRANFADLPEADIIAYNNLEIEKLELLANKTRKALNYHAPKRLWYGPGAVSDQWLKRQCNLSMADHRGWPEEMASPISHCYFGGRIDVAEIGEFTECHSYDINSAYPFAMTRIPYVEGWQYSADGKGQIDPFGIYHVTWFVPTDSRWCPFPFRTRHGTILYPNSGEGWYFGIEVSAAGRLYPGRITIIEAWKPIYPLGDVRRYPLRENIEKAYYKRLELKDKEDASELAYKLILNAIYGKFAQKTTSEHKLPRWQNYVWAGFTTAYTRAMLLDAIRNNPGSVVATATDSILCHNAMFGTDPVRVLGGWKYEGNYPTLICMPGVYARFKPDGTKKYRQRGMPMPINYGCLLRRWGCATDLNTDGTEEPFILYSKFVSFREAVSRGLDRWGFFQPVSKSFHDVTMFGFSKRFPAPHTLFEMVNWKKKDMFATPVRESEAISHPYAVPTFDEEVEFDDSAEIIFT